MSPDMERACRKGLDALDAALAGEVPPEHDPIADATRAAARLRDRLIELQGRGREVAPLLADANMLVSELVAGEFPVAGFRRKRIEKARDVFRSLVERVDRAGD